MDRAIQVGAARVIAAVICATATLVSAATPASAAEGPVPVTVGGVSFHPSTTKNCPGIAQ